MEQVIRLRDTVMFMKNITFLFFVQDPGMHAFNFTAEKSCISLQQLYWLGGLFMMEVSGVLCNTPPLQRLL